MASDTNQRLTARFVWKESLAFLSWEKGSPYTALRLFLRPGKTVHAYLDGERGRLTNPIRFLLMACALVTAAFLFGLPKDDYMAAADFNIKNSDWDSVPPALLEKVAETRSLLSEIRDEAEQKFLQRDAELALEALDRTLMTHMSEISLAWMNVFLLFGLPINALISWIFFRNAKLNFTEHIAANAYILGVQNLAAIFVVPFVYFSWLDFGSVSLMYMLLSFLYQFVAWKEVFSIRGFVWHCIGLVAIMLSVIGYVLVQGVATAIIFALSM